MSDAFMRPRRIEIRKQSTFTMETSTHDFSLFKKEKQMSAVLKPLSWVKMINIIAVFSDHIKDNLEH